MARGEVEGNDANKIGAGANNASEEKAGLNSANTCANDTSEIEIIENSKNANETDASVRTTANKKNGNASIANEDVRKRANPGREIVKAADLDEAAIETRPTTLLSNEVATARTSIASKIRPSDVSSNRLIKNAANNTRKMASNANNSVNGTNEVVNNASQTADGASETSNNASETANGASETWKRAFASAKGAIEAGREAQTKNEYAKIMQASKNASKVRKEIPQQSPTTQVRQIPPIHTNAYVRATDRAVDIPSYHRGGKAAKNPGPRNVRSLATSMKPKFDAKSNDTIESMTNAFETSRGRDGTKANYENSSIAPYKAQQENPLREESNANKANGIRGKRREAEPAPVLDNHQIFSRPRHFDAANDHSLRRQNPATFREHLRTSNQRKSLPANKSHPKYHHKLVEETRRSSPAKRGEEKKISPVKGREDRWRSPSKSPVTASSMCHLIDEILMPNLSIIKNYLRDHSPSPIQKRAYQK